MILFCCFLAFLFTESSELLFFRSSPENSSIRIYSEANNSLTSSLCLMELDENSFVFTLPACPGSSNGEILFFESGIIGGTGPFILDWDNLGTPENDIYPTDGYPFINGLPFGDYQFIVTDAVGCIATASVSLVNNYPFNVVSQIDSITGCESSGGILITGYSGPPGTVNFNWDLASTTYDDDFGVGSNTGLPPEENDAEDLITNALNGTYYLIITVSDYPEDPSYECIYRDTFHIEGESVTEICPFGEISFYAGTLNPALTYQWQIDSGNGYLNLNNGVNYGGTTTPTLNINDAPSSWYGHKYRAKMMQGGNITYSQEFILRFRLCWTGVMDISWENVNNWNCLTLPNANIDVFIPSGLIRYPKVNSNTTCRSIRLQPGATVDVKTPFSLLLSGD